jgi:hypothetical protein
MAQAPRLRKDGNKGTQRTRKLSTVYSVDAGEMRRNAAWCVAMETDRRCCAV